MLMSNLSIQQAVIIEIFDRLKFEFSNFLKIFLKFKNGGISTHLNLVYNICVGTKFY